MKRRLTLALTTVLGLAALFTIDSYYRDQIRQENIQQLTAGLELAKKSLEEGIDQRILVVEDLRAFVLAFPTIPDHETFNRYAAIVLSHSPEVRAFQYVDTEHIIRYIYPLEGNEAALNLDLMTRPAAPFVEKAIQTRATTVNDPTVTVQGSLSIVVRSPIYDGDRYLGLAQGVIDITSLLEDVSKTLTPHFDILLKDADGNIFWETESLVGNPRSSTVQVGDNSWELTLGWVPPEPGPESYILGLIWGLGGAFLISLLFTINQTFRRVSWLAAAVKEKTVDLAESEARYRTLVETADDIILLTDLEGRVLYYNSAYYTSLGFEKGEDVELDQFARVHPEDEPILRKKINELLATGTMIAEYRVRHKDDHWVHCYARSKLIRDEQGNPQSILTIIRDITERKQTEEALRESEASLRESQRVAHVGHWVWDTQKNQVVWSDEMKRIFGLDPTQFTGDLNKIIEQVIHPEDREKVIKANSIVLTEQKPAPIEYRIVLPDQSIRTIWAVPGNQIVDESGKILKLTGIVQDITVRKQAEDALREIAENMAAAQRIAHFGSWEIEVTPDLEFVNPQLWSDECYRIFGVEPGSVKITKEFFYRHVHPDDRESASQALLKTIQEHAESTYEYRLVQPNGSIRYIRDQAKAILDEYTGRPVKVVGIVRDITDRKQAEEEREKLEKQLRQAQKMEAVGQLTAGIAHDFNNLIMAINGNAELMQIEIRPEDPLYAMTDTILQAGSRAANLVRQLLIFSRKQIMTPEIVELNAIITEMNRLLERIIGENIEVKLNLAADLWPVEIDPAQIEQVVVNLVVNARDAMPEGGKLILETANVVLDEAYTSDHLEVHPGEYVLLTVSDTGVGMSQEVQVRLFEPFFTTKGTGKGTGLGLATVYGIVKQSDGHIWVYSEEGQGSTFKVYLPRTTEKVIAPLSSSPPTKEARSGQETILVVEDDRAIRKLATNILQKQGYTVLAAEDSQQALQIAALHTGPIHLLLTDVIMPGMSGKALAEELIQSYPQLKIIFMSGYADEIISHHGVLEPGVVLLQKPFSFMEMARKVREMLS